MNFLEKKILPVQTMLAALALLVVISMTSAWAQNATIAGDTLITYADKSILEAMINHAGDVVSSSDDNTGQPYAVGQVPDGLNYVLQATACNPQCRGLAIIFYFEDSASLEKLNDFNYQHAATSVWQSPDGGFGLNRYLILDNGQTMDNLHMNLTVAKELVAQLIADLAP